MFETLNLTTEKIYESNKTQALFCFALGHLKQYIYFSECLLAEPGDKFYERHLEDVIQGKEYIKKEQMKSAKNCVKNLLRLKCIQGFIKSYKIKSENGHYEDQDLILDAFSKYIDSVNINLNGKRFFDEAEKLLQE